MRPMLPADAPLLAEIFRASVEELGLEDYSASQVEAWAAAADDEAFAKSLGENLTLVALLDGEPVGFASLKGNDRLDMLYVHPAVIGQGAATMLVDALEKLARGRGSAKLTVDASDTAEGFFQSRGYAPQSRNTVLRGNEWLANTTMAKALAEESKIQ
ncbi:MAG: GNAT family N-acetyltransferase [Pseudorhodoplanes sp.]